MRPSIKINFVDFYTGFNKEDNEFIDILSLHYNVELSNRPDFVFYSCFGYEHLKYNCVRIFFTGECFTPDFNECDYAIGFDRLSFGDRYIRIPLYNLFQYKKVYHQIINRSRITEEELHNKDGFCSFVYSNCFAQDERTKFFQLLNQYKKVNSGGRYMNNIGGAVHDKCKFQSKHKFVIAFENTSYPGYCTEKLVDAFAARAIPIYYGDPQVAEDFNADAFINVHSFISMEEVIKRIKELDNNDNKYLAVVNTSIVKHKQADDALHDYLLYIVSQDKTMVYRRPMSATAKAHEDAQLRHSFFESHIYKYYRKAVNQWIRMHKNTKLSTKK